MEGKTLASNMQPYFEKGMQAYTQGSYEYAVDLFSFVVKNSPDATEARRFLRLATQKLAIKNPPSFAGQIGFAIISLPLRVSAALASSQGQLNRAIRIYENLITMQPRSKRILMDLALCLEKSQIEEAACSTYEELLLLDPNNIQACRRLARLFMKRGQDERARRHFEKILKMHPNDLEAQQSLRNIDALGTIKKGFNA